MSVDQNKSILQGLREAINSGNFDTFDDLVVEDFQEHLNVMGASPGREGYRQMMQGMRAAFPDFTVEHHNVIGEGDMISFRMTATGTHLADFAGIPPTGRRISVQGMEMMRFESGKAVERWGEIDQLGMLQQLGVMPAPGQP
jgi:steroid delta-isomerase-like uncharacterized protein